MRSKPRGVILVGRPSAGKTSYALSSQFANFHYIDPSHYEHDCIGLVRLLGELIANRENVIIDSKNCKRLNRRHWMNIFGKDRADYRIECHVIEATISDATKNGQLRAASGGERLNKFDLIRFHREYEKPSIDEGFDLIKTIQFNRSDEGNQRRALFFGLNAIVCSLRDRMYPTEPSDLRILPEVNEAFCRYYNEGYLLIGVGNIPGIASGAISEDMAHDCLLELIKQISCPVANVYYSDLSLREEQSKKIGLPSPHFALLARDRFQINLEKSIMVGGFQTDKMFATNANIGHFFFCEDFLNDPDHCEDYEHYFQGIS